MSRFTMSQLEIRGIEVGPRCLGMEDTKETDLIGKERLVAFGAGGGETCPFSSISDPPVSFLILFLSFLLY